MIHTTNRPALPPEPCAFCHTNTQLWAQLAPGSTANAVPVCGCCDDGHQLNELPTGFDWFHANKPKISMPYEKSRREKTLGNYFAPYEDSAEPPTEERGPAVASSPPAVPTSAIPHHNWMADDWARVERLAGRVRSIATQIKRDPAVVKFTILLILDNCSEVTVWQDRVNLDHRRRFRANGIACREAQVRQEDAAAEAWDAVFPPLYTISYGSMADGASAPRTLARLGHHEATLADLDKALQIKGLAVGDFVSFAETPSGPLTIKRVQ